MEGTQRQDQERTHQGEGEQLTEDDHTPTPPGECHVY